MSSKSRLDRAYKNAKRIPFDDTSKFILFSDCHRGDNSFADDFANNRNIYFHALKHYYNQGFQYQFIIQLISKLIFIIHLLQFESYQYFGDFHYLID